MALYEYSRFKIRIDPGSKKRQGLHAGDVVRRQYADGAQTFYSLMVVLATGEDSVLLYEGENETYIEASVENSSSILYDKEIRNKPRTRRTKRNV